MAETLAKRPERRTRQVSELTIYFVRYLPTELPSRRDSAALFFRKAAPYNFAGLSVIALVGALIPSARSFPSIWLSNLKSLADWPQILVQSILTAVWVWATSYSIGVLLIEKSRRYYRDYIVRPIETRGNKIATSTPRV